MTRYYRIFNDVTIQSTSVSDEEAKNNNLPRMDCDKLEKMQVSVFRLMILGTFGLFLGVKCYIDAATDTV